MVVLYSNIVMLNSVKNNSINIEKMQAFQQYRKKSIYVVKFNDEIKINLNLIIFTPSIIEIMNINSLTVKIRQQINWCTDIQLI